MSRSKELVKNTAILTIGKICTQFISFMLLPLYTTLLSTDEYGIVDLITTYISLLLPLVCWQLDQGIFRFILDYRKQEDKIKSVFTSVLLLNTLQCLVLLFIYVIVSPLVDSEYKIYLLIGVILNVFSGLLMQFSRGLGKMQSYSIGSFISAASTVVLNVLFVAILKLGAHGMFIATMCGIGINCLYLGISLQIWQFISPKRLDLRILKEVCKYSLPLVPNQISGWILSASDRTIIAKFLNIAANGIYSVSNKFSNLVGTFYGFFNLAWVESVSVHFNDEDRDEYISEMIDTVLNLFISACVVIIAVMPFVFPVMVNQMYSAAYKQIPILMISVVFQVLVGLYSAVYIALKKSSVIARTTIVGAIINVVVNLVLVNYVGLYAASISTLVSYACTALYRRIDIKKYVKIHTNYQKIGISVLVTVIVLISYYRNMTVSNCVALALAIFYALKINKKLIKIMVEEFNSIRRNER